MATNSTNTGSGIAFVEPRESIQCRQTDFGGSVQEFEERLGRSGGEALALFPVPYGFQ